jgi:ribulose-phosphate 3-epimerase
VIAPSLLSADFTKLGEEITALEKAGADLLHLDIMDGHFVPNITFGPMVVKQIDKVTHLPLDVHLMITSPERYVDDFIEAGADYVTVHAESTVHLNGVLANIRKKGVKAGVSLNPSTSLSFLEEVVNYTDLVLIMTVNPGFGGQSFIPGGLDKVRRVKNFLRAHNSNALLEVDGGVSDKNAESLFLCGADILVAGSYIFSREYIDAIKSLKLR